MESIWSRSDNLQYPQIWCEFTANESKQSDRQIKYWIQDLPEDRFDDAIQHLADHFLINAPISKFFGAATNKPYAEDYLRVCRWRLLQKTSLVCFRDGSDEIVGLNVTFVGVKNDPLVEQIIQATQTNEFKEHMGIANIMYKNVNLFDKYGIDKNLACMCLSVASTYRGLNIGQRLLEAQKPLCKALNIHVVQSFFSSDYSNHIADKIGFKIEAQYTMHELNEIYPKIPFHQIEAKEFAVKSWNLKNN